jgi:hypothetical protein
MDLVRLRRLEINGGTITDGPPLRLYVPAGQQGYADAQFDDYGARSGGQGMARRRHYPWRPGLAMRMRARFSHPAGQLLGTAGFGFWNAPIGDPTVPWPALPQATWFFYGSAPTDLPLAPRGPGQGWFASTIDAASLSAVAIAPLTPFVLLLNQVAWLRHRLWPAVQRQLGISYAQLEHDITEWRDYDLVWSADGCRFYVDGMLVLQTPFSPRGPLGFVCWLDNQYMVATPRGRFAWGTLSLPTAQWLEVSDWRIDAPTI